MAGIDKVINIDKIKRSILPFLAFDNFQNVKANNKT